MSAPSTNTTTSNNQPPQQFLDAYSNTYNQAQGVASTPYAPYGGQTVAGVSPDQQAGITAVQNAQGAATPYINSAAQYVDASTQPIWSQVQQFSPGAVQQYQSPYTQDVVNATQAEFNNQNAQQQQGVVGNAISSGAWGGDRTAVAQGITAGQEALAQAPVIAGLNNQGYAQALNEFNTQQGSQLGATQANAWLNSQAGAAMGNLGQEALGTSLTGANAELGIGGLEQTQAQAGLNVPYQQYLAQQAYPFQTTGWLGNIAEGLGGASGGMSSTTAPGPSVASQVGGGALAGAGILGQTGAYGSAANGYSGWLTNAFGAGGNGSIPAAASAADSFVARGGPIPHRDIGGGIPNLSISVVPGSVGLGAAPLTHGPMDVLKNYGDTSTSTSSGGESGIGSVLQTAGQIAAGIYGGPAGAAAAGALNSQVHFSEGGGITAFPAHRARAPGTGRGIVANDDWGPEPIQHRATGGGFTMMPSSHGGPAVPFMLPPSGVSQSGGIGGAGNPSPIQAYFDRQNAGRSFALPPGPLRPFVPPSAPATPLNVPQAPGPDNQASIGGGNARGGIVARRDDGGNVPPDNGNGAGILPGVAVSRAIQGIEGHGTSIQGANDGIMPETFKQYARHGEDFGNPDDRSAVRERIIGDLASRPDVNGDPARIAVGFFSGPGNIAPPGSPTPWKHDASDALGTSTSDYVRRVLGAPGVGPHEDAPSDQDQYSFATTSRPAGAGIVPPDASPDAAPSSSSWRMLTNVGLGIMGGTSPQAGVNIGKGALTGIAQTDKENQTEAAQAMAREQQKSTSMFRTGQQALEQAKLKQTGDLGQQQRDIETARLAEQSREHNQSLVPPDVRTAEWLRTATPEQKASYTELQARNRPFTYQAVTQPDPDDPTKTISGVMKLDPRGVAPPEFIRTDTNPNKPGAAAGLNGREGIMLSRVSAAGNSAAAAIRNIMELPTTASTGWFGGRQQGTGLLAAGREALTNTMTSQGVQDFNSMAVGVGRNLSTLETQGLAPSGSFTHSMDSVMLKEGDSEMTKMRKLAEMRQIVETNLEPNLSNPRIPPEQKKMIQGIISQVQTAVPFTHHDVTALQATQSKNPQATMADYMKANGLGSVASSASVPTAGPTATWAHTAVGPGGATLHSNDGKSWFTPDGKPYAP